MTKKYKIFCFSCDYRHSSSEELEGYLNDGYVIIDKTVCKEENVDGEEFVIFILEKTIE